MTLALSYFLLCAAAKGFIAAIHGYDWSWGTPAVLLWQDALIALGIAGLSSLSKRAAQIIYWVLVLHLVACMPLLQVMATPLTRYLLKAASGTLRDSLTHYLNFNHLAPSVIILLLAAGLPRLLIAFTQGKLFRIAVASLALVSVAGWGLTPRIEVHGLQRNFAVALIDSYGAAPEFAHVALHLESEHACSSAPKAGSASGLNLLVITLESTGSRFLQQHGSSDPMPRLSALAREGWVIENAYAPYPESVKGLLSVLASRQPRLGLNESDFAKLAAPSLASVLSANGYETALFHSGRFMYLGMDSLVRSAGFCLAEDAGDIGGERESSFGVDDQQTVERILRWVDSRKTNTPFYIHYLPITGHHPYDAPTGPWKGSDDKSRYLNALHYSDDLAGQLLDGLQARGFLDKTVVLIFGDHGEAFGEHPGNYGHTLFLYEENLRVPLIFWKPGAIPTGRCERPASLVDLAPTICDLLGVKKPDSFEGLSLLEPARRPVLFMTDYSLRLIGIRDGPWKYIYERDSGFPRLFNLQNDPQELHNLAASNPERVARYNAHLFQPNGSRGKLSLAKSR